MRSLRFRLTALVAAYALALHALLLAFVVAAPASVHSHFGTLCSGLSSDDGAPPLRHDAACAAACTVLGGPMAQPQPPAISVFAPVLVLVLGAATREAPPNAAIADAPRARAPPVA